MRKTTVTKFIAGLMTFAILLTVFLVMPKDAHATETSVVKYQEVTSYDDFKDCIDNHKVPTCNLTGEASGYLFAGWYFYENGVAGEPITSSSETNENSEIAAKFIPARLTGISCQIGANVEADGVTSTNLRVVSTVDSGNFGAVGFNVYGREKESDGSYAEWVMYEYGSANAAQSTKVYSGLWVYKYENDELVKDKIKYPADIFGEDATNFKFTTMSLTGIPKASYSTIVAIKPYWITLDGTYVEGIGEYNRVQDGIDDIVNVSVNLKNAKDIAAGLLSVTYDKANFTYVEAECGRVFEEMEYFADTSKGIVKCVGNVGDVTDNSAKPNDIYVNLRFKKTDANTLASGTAEFTVGVEEDSFCNLEEKNASVDAWNVWY